MVDSTDQPARAARLATIGAKPSTVVAATTITTTTSWLQYVPVQVYLRVILHRQ